MPLDQMYAPGAAPDAEFPLRGHRLREQGVLGGVPIGRELGLFNIEVRREVWGSAAAGLGIAVFHDAASVRRAALGSDRVLFDAGVGLRVRIGKNSLFRMDYGRSLRNDGSAVTVSVGEAF
jgi:hypothetical protein